MKLTNYIRDAFVRAAMQDVPKQDYDTPAHKLAQDHLVSKMPANVRKVYEDKAARHYLDHVHTFFTGPLGDAHLYGATDYRWIVAVPDLQAQIDALAGKAETQARHLAALKSSLKGAAYAVTTRKALAELLPEFEKYLPAETETVRNLPAVANLVSDFVKAGWPKQNKGRIAKAAATI